jgi:hypothetical protein
MAASNAGFRRKPPPLPLRVFMGLCIDCIGAPLVRLLEKSGRIDKMLAKAAEKREKNILRLNPFRNYVPGKQDVFVMTYAKSGTNWMMQIVWQLIHHGEGEFDHIHSVVPWPDAVLISPAMKNYAIPLDQAVEWQTAPERKRVIKTHLNWELLPYSEDARYIAVLRDPKDVFVSAYFFLRDSGLGPAMPSADTMYRIFLAGKSFLGGSWAVNAAGFWAQRNKPNVLVVSFAEMKRDLEGIVRRVAGFLDIHVSEEVIREVCRKASFDYMKGIDGRFAPFQSVPWRKRSQMMRKGKQGASSELLSPERQREMDAVCMAELQRLGSDLPYDEICGRSAASSKASAG